MVSFNKKGDGLMRKVLAVFMAVMMILSTFAGIMTVSAADVTTTLVEIALGNTSFSSAKAGTGTLAATDYIKEKYTFTGVMNTSWSDVKKSTKADAKTIIATYAEPQFTFSAVDTSTLSAYSDIAAGHSSKLMKMTQTANVTMFRLKDFYDVSKLPATGKLRFSIDVYPADVTPGTTENTTTSSVKSGTAALADDYSMRIGNSKGSGDSSIPKTTVKANQWNTVLCEVTLPLDTAMNSIRFDVATGAAVLNSYTTPFPATVFYDKLKIEYIGEAISGGGSTGGDNTGGDNTGGGDSGSTEKVKVNIGFEDGTAAPSTGKAPINFWGKKPSDGSNTDALQKVINWADETTISKPNSTENFGSKLIKVDGNSTVSTKGVYTGRINDIPAANIGFTAGKKYTFSAWILIAKTAASDTVQVVMYPYCNNQGTAGIPMTAFNTEATLKVGEWQKVEGSFVATEAHVGKNAGFRFRLSEVNGTNYITLLYMDNLNIVESDDTAASYDLKVTAEGNGTVTGAGKYSEGTVATLKATPDSGYEFAGWYDGTTLLSKENPYEYTVDGKVTSITAKFEKVQPNKGDNWYTIDTVDFEDATASGTSCTGKTANSLPYTFSALDGGVTTVKLSSAALTEAEAGIGTSSNKVYKFAKTEGPDANSGMMRFSNFFSLDKLSVGDIIRVSFKVYPTDLCVMEGKSDKTAGFQAFYSISGKYGSGSAKNASDSTGSRYLKLNEWNNIGFTTTVNQEMLDASKTGALRLSAINEQSYAKTMYFDDFKVEVYQDKSAADELYIVENFDNERPVSNISATAGFETAPYIAKIFTKSDNNGKYARFNVFGTGTAGSNVSLVTNKADLSGVLAHSGTNAIKFSGRWSANGGVKVEDIFMGRFDKEDIGRKVKVSAWVYADKSAGAYKMTANGEGFKENGSKNDAPKYTDDELAKLEKTKICISFGGPNDGFYSYRTGGYNTKKYTINWNEWTKISTEFIVYEDLLDNGTTDKNPLISSIRIDQQGCTGIEDEAVIDTFYIDDITVEEPKFEVSSAIGTHMVYQKGRPIRVWGTNADIGEEVTVKFNGVTKTATTAEDKKWVAEFDKIDSYTRNLEIEVACPGEETLKFTDVSVGEVILASGQSNMEWNLKKVYEAEDIIADAETNDNISILSFEPSQSNRGSYEVLTSPKGAYWAKKDTAAAEICSGVGYITAYNIAKKYNIPVAVVDANLSGSAINAWLSAETIEARKDDVYKAIYEEMINKSSSVSSGSIWKVAPAGMYNSLLAPLDNYEIGIMLWYQGCSNSGRAMLYNYQQYDLINSWRDLFGTDDTPFYICQLAPYSSSYMNLRQVQLDTAKRMDNVHLIVTADLGPTGTEDQSSKLWSEMTDGNEIHPVRKIPVADRISLNLYANYFGEDILYSGPEYIKMEAKDNYAILHFKHIGSGLVKADPDKELTGFEVSADGETFVKATAEILADNTIKVYAEGVDKVVKARYCWVNWVVPEDALTSEGGKKLGNTLGGNLTNETGIPAGPFMATLPAPTIFAAETATLATGLSIDISVRNIGYSESSPRLIVGLYDGERLVGLKSETIDFMTIDTKTVEFDFYTLTTLINENTTIKAFLWNDMGSMIPLTGVYPIERK